MRPGSHIEILCDPSEADRRLLTQSSRERDLGLIALAPPLQLRLGPTSPLEFFLYDSQGFGLLGLIPLAAEEEFAPF